MLVRVRKITSVSFKSLIRCYFLLLSLPWFLLSFLPHQPPDPLYLPPPPNSFDLTRSLFPSWNGWKERIFVSIYQINIPISQSINVHISFPLRCPFNIYFSQLISILIHLSVISMSFYQIYILSILSWLGKSFVYLFLFLLSTYLYIY